MTAVIEPTLFDEPHAEPVDAQTASLLELVAGDRIHEADRRRVVEAIAQTARDHAGLVDPNHVRALLWRDGQCLVCPAVIGATVAALRHKGVLEPAGWVVTEGSTTGNNGRPQRAYRWVGAS